MADLKEITRYTINFVVLVVLSDHRPLHRGFTDQGKAIDLYEEFLDKEPHALQLIDLRGHDTNVIREYIKADA